MITHKKVNLECYNDGMVSVYRPKNTNVTSFNGKQNVKKLSDMDFIVKLCFKETSKRVQDLEFANQNGFILNTKIKTRYVNNVDNKCKCVINGLLYDISYIDKTKQEIYFYLSGGVVIGNT